MTDADTGPMERGETAPELARALLRDAETCTLATASPAGVPEAATVRFVHDDEFTIGINTIESYRKYEHLTANPRVAVVVDGADENLQLEGAARELDGEAAATVRERYAAKYGESEYLTHEDSVQFAIEPDWARLLVGGGYPPEYAMVLGDGETDLH
jgi:nitroimidazol reductase NimA-like FMN-containing flavoprotein (pyridoxamine 5'-phosphate oxidase superfamily)